MTMPETIPEPNLFEIIGRLVAGQAQMQAIIAAKDEQLAALTAELAATAQTQESDT